jgi:hypothetical protein
MPDAFYWAVPCGVCDGMIALALVEFDSEKKAIEPTPANPFEADCPLCRNRKTYAVYEVIMWKGPLPAPVFHAHPAFQ